MSFQSRFTLALLGAAPVLGALAACSSAGTDPMPAGQSAAPPSHAVVDEPARAQAFVDARYVASDVKHSFRTRFGETVDCIDFFAQSGVKALAARGAPITELPHAAKRPELTAASPLALAMFDGSLDEDGNERRCSDTTVPKLRITADDIARAGGLDHYLAGIKKSPPPPVGEIAPPGPDSAGYAHSYVSYSGAVPTDRATLSVWAPNLTANPGGNHSLEQTWTYTGGGFWSATAACAPDCFETVEVGWTVDASLANGVNAASPHLFTYSTPDGYETGCYDGDIPSSFSNSFSCPPWIGLPGAAFVPGMTLTASTASPGSRQELTVEVTQCSVSGNCPDGWEILVRSVSTAALAEVGYYPSSDYSGAFKSAAATFQAGGEVSDVTELNTTTGADGWNVQMGSGSAASAGFGVAGYVHDYDVYVSGSPSGTIGAPIATRPANYGVWTRGTISTSAESVAGWSNFFYIGAPPLCGDCAGGQTCFVSSGEASCECPDNYVWSSTTNECVLQCKAPAVWCTVTDSCLIPSACRCRGTTCM